MQDLNMMKEEFLNLKVKLVHKLFFEIHINLAQEYNILKMLEEIIMKILKKTFGVCLMGLGIGILLVLFLPIAGWLFLIGIIVILVGILWLLC